MADRKPKPTLGVTYLVVHDPAAGSWNIMRGGKPTGAFARSKSTAIGNATGAASLEAHQTNMRVAVYSIEDGKRTKEWPKP